LQALYDLQADPHETENLLLEPGRSADSYREELRKYLAEARRQLSRQQGDEITLDESVLEELRALGYIEP
jgi:hypothetical protein